MVGRSRCGLIIDAATRSVQCIMQLSRQAGRQGSAGMNRRPCTRPGASVPCDDAPRLAGLSNTPFRAARQLTALLCRPSAVMLAQGAPSMLGAGLARGGAMHSNPGPGPARSASSTSARPPSSKLPDFVGQPVTFTGVVKKVNWRGDGGVSIMTIQVPPDTWRSLLPLLKHRDLPTDRDRSAAGLAAWGMHKYKMANRCVSVRGPGMARIGEGCTCRFSGAWAYGKHGLEVTVGSWAELESDDPEVLKVKLQRMLEGVGAKTAALLVDSFGLQVEAVLASPDAVAQLTSKTGLTRGRAAKIKAAYEAATGEQGVAAFLADLGLPRVAVKAALSRYDPATLRAKMAEDPYDTLMDLPAFSFTLADEAACRLGCSSEHPSRGPAAMLQALLNESASAGHTFSPLSRIRTVTQRLLAREDAAWAGREARRDAASGSGDGERSVTTQAHSRSPSPPARPASLASMAPSKSDAWLTRLLARRKVVVELVQQAGAPPVRLSADNWRAGQTQDNGSQALASSPSPMPPDASPPHPSPPIPAAAALDVATLLGQRSGSPAASGQQDVPDGGLHGSRAAEGGPAPDLVLPRWPDHAMVYVDALHVAEVTVATGLSKLLARMPPMLAPASAAAAGAEREAQGGRKAASQPSGEERDMEALVWKAKNRLLQQGVALTDKQVEAVRLAVRLPVLLLTGAAGCGKTFGTKAIMAALLGQNKQLLLCAPTGRAAQRLQEAGSDFSLTASTIHRMLGYKPLNRADKPTEDTAAAEQEGAARSGKGRKGLEGGDVAGNASSKEQPNSSPAAGGAGPGIQAREPLDLDVLHEDMFEYNSFNPLPAHAVLVDEASMLDVQLAAALLRALPPHCQLILIGDPNQLPPVGPGSVLHDMIASGMFPQVHLDQIFRQGRDSSIVAGAHHVMHGRSPIPGHSVAADSYNQPEEDYWASYYPGSSSADATPSRAGGAAPPAEGGLLDLRMSDLRRLLQTAAVAEGNAARPPSAPRRESPIQPLMPVPESDTEAEEGRGEAEEGGSSGGSPVASSPPGTHHLHHSALGRLQALLGSDGIVVRDHVPETDVPVMVSELVTLLQRAGVDVASEVQVLSATKETHAGTHALNRVLQPVMNPCLRAPDAVAAAAALSGPAARSRLSLKVGDRVVQVENNYESEVFNGDLGTVVDMNHRADSITVHFTPRPGAPPDVPHVVRYGRLEQFQLQLAWATTVHKAQGAEYPAVLMVLHDSASKSLQQRKLLYTAITRGRRLLFLLTTPPALGHAVNAASEKPRHTALHLRLAMALGHAPGRGPEGAALAAALPCPPAALPPVRARAPTPARGRRLAALARWSAGSSPDAAAGTGMPAPAGGAGSPAPRARSYQRTTGVAAPLSAAAPLPETDSRASPAAAAGIGPFQVAVASPGGRVAIPRRSRSRLSRAVPSNSTTQQHQQQGATGASSPPRSPRTEQQDAAPPGMDNTDVSMSQHSLPADASQRSLWKQSPPASAPAVEQIGWQEVGAGERQAPSVSEPRDSGWPGMPASNGAQQPTGQHAVPYFMARARVTTQPPPPQRQSQAARVHSTAGTERDGSAREGRNGSPHATPGAAGGSEQWWAQPAQAQPSPHGAGSPPSPAGSPLQGRRRQRRQIALNGGSARAPGPTPQEQDQPPPAR